MCRTWCGALFAAALALGCGRRSVPLGGDALLVSDVAGASGEGGEAGAGARAPCARVAFEELSPAPGATDVPTRAKISLRVRCDDGSAPDPALLTLGVSSPTEPVDGSVTFEPASETLTFEPGRPLGLGARYVVSVRRRGVDDEGVGWTFWTIDGAWQAPEALGAGGHVVLAVDATGNGVVAYDASEGEHGMLRTHWLSLETGASPESESLLDDEPSTPRALKVAMANGGSAVAAWADGDIVAGGAVHLRRGDGALGWEPEQPFDPPGAARFVEDLTLGRDGTGFLLWSERPNGRDQPGSLFLASIVSGHVGPVSPLVRDVPLDAVRGSAEADGAGWVVWSSWTDRGRVFARHGGPGDWADEELVREPAARAAWVSAGADGSALVLWEEGASPGLVMAERFTRDRGQSGAVLLDTAVPAGTSSGYYARAAIDPSGRALALWVNHVADGETEVDEIRAQAFDPASGWADGHTTLDPGTSGDEGVLSSRALALDPQGNGFAVFGHTGAAGGSVCRWVSGVGWSAPVRLASGATAPVVAVDASGRAAVAWSVGGTAYLRRFTEEPLARPRLRGDSSGAAGRSAD